MSNLPSVAPGSDIYYDSPSFEHAQRVAKVFASSTLVPEHLRKNHADALVALGIARALGEQPLVVMQNIYFVSGRAGWSTKYKIARANRAGVFAGPIRWSTAGAGDTLAVTAYADLVGVQGDPRVEVVADMRLAKAEGWTKNAKYQSMPEHMLRWRSASMLIDLYCPDVMLGLPTVEEIETMPPVLVGGSVVDMSGASTEFKALDIPTKTAPTPPASPVVVAQSPGPVRQAQPSQVHQAKLSPDEVQARAHALQNAWKASADATDKNTLPQELPLASDDISDLETQVADMLLDASSPNEARSVAKFFAKELSEASDDLAAKVSAQIEAAAAALAKSRG